LTQGDTISEFLPPIYESYENLVFRVERYPSDFPGFDGKDLTPGDPLENYAYSVYIDIAPQKCENSLNKKKPLAVVIPGTDTFDVTTINISSIWIEGAFPLRWSYEDTSTPSTDGCSSYESDGFTDLILYFNSREILRKFPGASIGDEIQIHLTGSDASGKFFIGADTVAVSPE
jgi:hypothetical protein